ncbi:MAG: hotdog fold thioesterase [Rothia sp. (in: high G+C Gram-positive bacteria)]|nr:hotdog fold thioesterase [Rothia sp. (in: high G+C Gram-positive bacteria)]
MNQQPSDGDHYLRLLDRLGSGDLAKKLGIRILQASPELTIATMPVEGNTQPVGLLHGGASAALAETLGSLSAFLSVAEQKKAAVGVDLNITHLRPVRSGTVTARCQAVKLGRTVCVHTVDLRDDADRLIATARISNQIIDLP